jgi:hypothetical protein
MAAGRIIAVVGLVGALAGCAQRLDPLARTSTWMLGELEKVR